jgi:hypothetical protein
MRYKSIRITVPTDTIYERHLNEIARAQAERAKAVQEYNIMMGYLEDPSEDEEEEEEGE